MVSDTATMEYPIVTYDGWVQRGQYAELEDGRVFYVREGDGDPLLLVHFFGGNSWWYSRVVSRLAEHFDVIVPDLPGCGRSDTPWLPYDVPDVARSLMQLLDVLGIERAHLGTIGGASMTAVHLATTEPERVDKLAMEALCHWTRHEAKELWDNTIRGRWIDDQGNAKPFDEWGDVERAFSPLPLSARQMAVDRMRTDFEEHGRWWATLLTVGQLRYDVNPRLPAIAAPTLLIFGSAAPPFLRLHQDEAAAAIPNARLERVPGASAHSPFDAPETYVPLLLEFLENGEAVADADAR